MQYIKKDLIKVDVDGMISAHLLWVDKTLKAEGEGK